MHFFFFLVFCERARVRVINWRAPNVHVSLQFTRSRIDMKWQIEDYQWMITRGSYVHKPMVKFLGASKNNVVVFLQVFQNINAFRQNNSQGFKNSQNSVNKIH